MTSDLLYFEMSEWHVVTISAQWIAILMIISAFVGMVAGACLYSSIDSWIKNWDCNYRWDFWRK